MSDEFEPLAHIGVWHTSLVVPCGLDNNTMRPLTPNELGQVADLVLTAHQQSDDDPLRRTSFADFAKEVEATSTPEERAELEAFREWHRRRRDDRPNVRVEYIGSDERIDRVLRRIAHYQTALHQADVLATHYDLAHETIDALSRAADIIRELRYLNEELREAYASAVAKLGSLPTGWQDDIDYHPDLIADGEPNAIERLRSKVDADSAARAHVEQLKEGMRQQLRTPEQLADQLERNRKSAAVMLIDKVLALDDAGELDDLLDRGHVEFARDLDRYRRLNGKVEAARQALDLGDDQENQMYDEDGTLPHDVNELRSLVADYDEATLILDEDTRRRYLERVEELTAERYETDE